MASTTRAFSAVPMRKRSAITSSTLRGPVGVATSRSACTLVNPLAESHCSTCSALVLAGSSTGKVRYRRGSPACAARCASSAYTVSGLSVRTLCAVSLSNNWPRRANNNFRWSFSSVMVPTVERELRTGLVWSIAIAGGTPSTLSTAGLSMRSRNWRA